MRGRSASLEALGGEEGCRRLSAAFYARVGMDPVLRPFFPGKSLRCATEEFAAFLIQFLGGDEKQTQYRWWLSLRESHARFQIGPDARLAWLRHMEATLDAAPLDDATRTALRHFFSHSSAYLIGGDTAELDHEELAARWSEQRVLDGVIAAIVEGRDDETLALAPRFSSCPSVFVGLLARMVQSGRARLIQFVLDAVESDPSLATQRFADTTLLHFAAGAGCLELVALLLRLGVDPNIQGRGRTPLYCVANECVSETGLEVVRALMRAGADVNASCGVTRATPLHPGEDMWKSRERCSIPARQRMRGPARATRLYNARSIVAKMGSRSCYASVGPASTGCFHRHFRQIALSHPIRYNVLG